MIDVNKAKQKILDLAIRGKLTKQLKSDGNAEDLFVEIQKEKERLIKEKKLRDDKNIISEEIEEPFEIPENWKWCRMNQMTIVISKGTTPRGGKNAYVKSGIRFLRAENILGLASLDTCNSTYIDEIVHKSILKRSMLLEEDILISIAGTLGRTGLVNKELLPLNCNQAISFVRLVNRKKVIPKYIIYALNSNDIKHILLNSKVDMAIPNISLQSIGNCVVPLPPITEQIRIVEKVELLFDILDKIDESQKKFLKDKGILKSKIIEAGIRGKLTKQLKSDGDAKDLYDRIQKEKEKLIKEGKIKRDKKETYIYKKSSDNLYYEKYHDGTEKCINDALPFEIPNSWVWARFNNIVNYHMGKTPPRADKRYWKDAKHKWITIADMVSNGIVIDSKEKVNDFSVENVFKNQISKKGTLIMSFKLTVGRVSILGIDGFHNEAIISVYPYCNKKNIIRDYLFTSLPLLTSYGDEKVAIKGNTLNKESINNLLVPMPPINEQERITGVIKNMFYIINNN